MAKGGGVNGARRRSFWRRPDTDAVGISKRDPDRHTYGYAVAIADRLTEPIAHTLADSLTVADRDSVTVSISFSEPVTLADRHTG